MNTPDFDTELDALFSRARAQRPDTSAAEYAFETRLLARLRAEQETGSIWARVSWRLVPFFALIVVALAVWQMEFSAETSDMATYASLDNPEAVDLWSNNAN